MLSPETSWGIQKRDNFICQYCGKDCLTTLDDWHACTVDHIIPISKGGTDHDDNLATACHYCNAIKGEHIVGSIDEIRVKILKRRVELMNNYLKVVAAMR